MTTVVTGPGNDLHFNIHASVVFQLGESLITDVVQALVELVKNAYDADANSATVIVDTTGDLPPLYQPTAMREILSKKVLRRAKSAGVS